MYFAHCSRWISLFSLLLAAGASAAYSGAHECHIKPLGQGVPGGVYVFISEKQVPSLEACNTLISQVHDAITGVFDNEIVYLERSNGCSSSSGRPTATAGFSYAVEAWSPDKVSEAQRELAQVDGKVIGGVTIRFEPVKKIDSRNTISLLHPANGHEGGSPSGFTLEAETDLYRGEYATAPFTSLIRWCQAPDAVQTTLSEEDFTPTADLIHATLGDSEFAKLSTFLPQATDIDFSYNPIFELSSGRKIEGSYGRVAWRDCRKLSCEL